MSETKAELEAYQYRRVRSLRAVVDSDSVETENTETVIDLSQPIEAITDDEIKANFTHDQVIKGKYEVAQRNIAAALEKADELHDDTTAQLDKNIKTAEVLTADRISEIDHKVDIAIAALELQRRRAKESELLRQRGVVAENKRKREEADGYHASNLKVITHYSKDYEEAVKYEADLEQDRDRKINEFNSLVAQKLEREKELVKAEENLETFSDKHSKKQKRLRQLLDQEDDLEVQKIAEVEELAKPKIEEFWANVGSEMAVPEGEIPAGFADSIEGIKKSVTSHELDAIIDNLATNAESKAHVKRSISHYEDLIGATQDQITKINEELRHLTARLIVIKSKLDNKIHNNAVSVQKHSIDAVVVSELLLSYLNGDTTEIAGQVVTPDLREVFENTRHFKKAITGNMKEAEEEVELPPIDIEMLSPLGAYLDDEDEEGVEGALSLDKEYELHKNASEGGRLLEEMTGPFKRKGKAALRGLLGRGLNYEVEEIKKES